jgi:ABC-2 type transport system permease protein
MIAVNTMRYLRIFFVGCQDVVVNRGVSFVWFLISLFNPLILLFYWMGSLKGQSVGISGWGYTSVISYYLLLIAASAMLESHIEETVARMDIQEGGLTKYLLKPFSYMSLRFLGELPWRLIQGFFGIVALLMFVLFFGIDVVRISQNPLVILFAICIAMLGYCISFLFKMLLGMTAFWTTDYSGIAELTGVVTLLFGGFVVPLTFFPQWLSTIANSLPFAYVIYYPIVAFQGNLNIGELFRVLGIQTVWIAVLFILYRIMWRNGVGKYTALGQ